MNIVHLNPHCDPAGVSFLLHCELKNLGHNSRHITSHTHIIQRGDDIVSLKETGEINKLVQDADILHINNEIDKNKIFDINMMKEKPFVFHNHGGYNLLYPELQIKRISEFRKNFIYIVCSPLTKLIIPQAIWVPNIVPINDNLYIPSERNFESKLLMCHKIFSLQSKLYKGSDILDEMINIFLKKEWKFNLEFDIFHSMKLNDILEKTKDYHICIDNLLQGFIGMAGWESLAKGQVVIARLDPLVKKYYEMLGKNCPIINVSGMDEMCKAIRNLHDNRNMLKEKCEESRKWMEENYYPKKIANMYLEVYKKTIGKSKSTTAS